MAFARAACCCCLQGMMLQDFRPRLPQQPAQSQTNKHTALLNGIAEASDAVVSSGRLRLLNGASHVSTGVSDRLSRTVGLIGACQLKQIRYVLNGIGASL